MSVRGLMFFAAALLIPTSLVRADARWFNRGNTPSWNDPWNWEDGHIPTASDAFYSTPKYVYLPTSRWSEYQVVINSGTDAICSRAKNMNQLMMTIDGGSLTVLNEWKVGQDDGPGTVVNLNSGDVDVGTYMDLGGWAENSSSGTLNISGGKFDVVGTVYMGRWGTTSSHLSMSGGILTAGALSFGPGPALVDMTGGEIILFGDYLSQIETAIDQGRIVAFGGTSPVFVDYGQTHPGRTTIQAVPEPACILLLALGAAGLRRRSKSRF